ncbi:hypothetical protein Q5P01_017367 [Channa striata]|uniref:Promethin n=1 Tax=Channa striata TaxID=64152 RepID=A0AA88M9X1_CHASR|nr:hypothetical protein Q5P01_017367 [Channa striata]
MQLLVLMSFESLRGSDSILRIALYHPPGSSFEPVALPGGRRRREKDEEESVNVKECVGGGGSSHILWRKLARHTFPCCEICFALVQLYHIAQCRKMQRSNSRRSSSSTRVGETDIQQLWAPVLKRLHENPKVKAVMGSGAGRYLSSHPLLALAALLFSTMAAVPVGLFLLFALVTIVMSAVGFVFFEVFLLFVAGLTLLSVLSGLALFSVLVSFIVNGFYLIIFTVLKRQPLTKQGEVQEESDSQTSEPKETS